MKAHIPWNPDVKSPAERAGYVFCVSCECWRPPSEVAHSPAVNRASICKDLELCKRLDVSHLLLNQAADS